MDRRARRHAVVAGIVGIVALVSSACGGGDDGGGSASVQGDQVVTAVSIVAGLYPAWKAARLEPLETLRLG